jgi:hypothetical protein
MSKTLKDMPKHKNPNYQSEDDRWKRKGGPHKKKMKPEPEICPVCWAQPGIMEFCENCNGEGEVE